MSTWKENIEMLPARIVVLPDNDPQKPYYNPSLVRYKGKLLISIRSSTWTLGPGGRYTSLTQDKLHTDVLLGELDEKTLTVKNLRKLAYKGETNDYIDNTGLEDARLFVRDDKLYAIGCCMSDTNRAAETVFMAIGEVKGDELWMQGVMPKPYKDRIEKNWTPPEVATDKFDYIYSPTQTIKDNVLQGEHEYHGLLHGGSPAIEWEGGWLTFQHKVHRAQLPGTTGLRQYCNYAIKHNQDGIATEISQGFLLFADNCVEFISGAVKASDGQLLVGMGYGDAHAVLAVINPDDLHFEPFDHTSEAIRAYLPDIRQATSQS
jgi:hypothetical protein